LFRLGRKRGGLKAKETAIDGVRLSIITSSILPRQKKL